jgi:hypothetical protein
MPNYDPNAASASPDFGKPNPGGPTEIVNGIPAKIQEVSGPPGHPTATIWIAERGKFIVNMEMTPPDGEPITKLEVK